MLLILAGIVISTTEFV